MNLENIPNLKDFDTHKIKKLLPDHIEEKLPKCLVLYAEPHIAYESGHAHNFEIKISYPMTDYYISHLKKHYNFKKHNYRPSPKEIHDMISGDMNNIYKMCKKELENYSGFFDGLKNYII